MADKPLTLAQITNRIETLESELSLLKSEVQKLNPKPSPTNAPNVVQVTTKEQAPAKPGFFSKWESFLGENLFIKLGLLTMLLGAIWFINLAFEEYWINESVRIWLGILIGIILFFQGTKLIANWPLIGPSLVGTGASLTFASYFLGFFVYDLYSMKLAFVGLVVLSLITIAFSYILLSEVIFGFGILGAFLVPTLLSTGENSYQFLFIYLLIWNLIYLAISRRTKWRVTPIILLLGNHLMFGGWAYENLEKSSWQIPLFFQSSIFLIFLVREHILVPRESDRDTIFSTVTVGLSLLFVFLQGYFISAVFFPEFQNALLMSFVVVYYLFFIRSFLKSDNKEAITDIFLGGTGLLGLLFTLATLVIGFEGRSLSVVVLSFAILLGFVGARINLIGIYAGALLFWAVGILKMIFANRWFGDDSLFLLNGYFLLYLLSAFMLFILYRAAGKKLEQVADIYKWAAFPVLLIGSWADVYYHISDPYQLLGYTSFLAVYGLGFTIISFIRPNPDLRKIGLLCLSVVIAKLYLYDFWNMGTLARILAGFGLGAALVFAGIIYNRSKKKNSNTKDSI
jgi:uncharacterized membrane protein